MLDAFEKSAAWDKPLSALNEEEREYIKDPPRYEMYNEGGFDLEKLGKTQHQSRWVDVENKAKRIVTTNGVALIHKHPYDLHKPLGIVEIKAKVRGEHGSYESTIHQPHPKSRAVRWWDCQCTWRRYVWDRRPIWKTDKNGIRREVNKKFEGRICSHVLALWWHSAGVPVSYEDVPVEIMQRDFPELVGQERLDGADWEKLQEINKEQEDLRVRKNNPDNEGIIREAEMAIADLEEELSQLDENDPSNRIRIMEIQSQIASQRESIDRANNAESINKSIQGQLTNSVVQKVIDQIGSGDLFSPFGYDDKWNIQDIDSERWDVEKEELLASIERNREALQDPSLTPENRKTRNNNIQTVKSILDTVEYLRNAETPEIKTLKAELIELNRQFNNPYLKRKYEPHHPKVRQLAEEIKTRQRLIQSLYKNLFTFEYPWTNDAWSQIDEAFGEVERKPNVKAEDPMPGIPQSEEIVPTPNFSGDQIEEALNFFRSNGMAEEAVDLRRAIEENDTSMIQELFAQYGDQKAERLGWANLFDQERSRQSSVSFISSDQPIRDIVVYLQKEIADNKNPSGYVRKEMWGEQRGGLHPHPDAQPIGTRPDGNFTYSIDDLGYHPERGEMGHDLEERGTYGSVPVGGEVNVLSVDPKNRLVMIQHELENEVPNHQHIRIWIPLKDIDLV